MVAERNRKVAIPPTQQGVEGNNLSPRCTGQSVGERFLDQVVDDMVVALNFLFLNYLCKEPDYIPGFRRKEKNFIHPHQVLPPSLTNSNKQEKALLPAEFPCEKQLRSTVIIV